MLKISIIGAGNLAFRFAIALQQAKHNVICVVNRDLEKAESIVRAVKRHKGNAFSSSTIEDLPQSDIIIIAVSDNAIEAVAENLAFSIANNECKNIDKTKLPLILHTCGAVSNDSLIRAMQRGCSSAEKHYNFSCGVLYPLMTLSKNKEVDIKMIPFLIESNNKASLDILITIVSSLKAEYKVCDSKKRLQMHTAAVFISNFINYMMSLSYDIAYPDFTYLLPCAIETIRKGFLNKPAISQTGPAIRKDTSTIEKHLNVLKDMNLEEHYQIYETLSKKIMESKSFKNK